MCKNIKTEICDKYYSIHWHYANGKKKKKKKKKPQIKVSMKLTRFFVIFICCNCIIQSNKIIASDKN